MGWEEVLATSIVWSISLKLLRSCQIMPSLTLLPVLRLPQHPKMMMHALFAMSRLNNLVMLF